MTFAEKEKIDHMDGTCSFNRWPISSPEPAFLFGQLTERKADPGDKISMFPKHVTCTIASSKCVQFSAVEVENDVEAASPHDSCDI